MSTKDNTVVPDPQVDYIRAVPYPELRDVLDKHKYNVFSTLNCVQLGTIESYDSETNTVSVTINFQHKMPDGRVFKYPVLADVPVFIYSGGYSHIVMPIEVGDTCLVLFCDRDIDIWHHGGETDIPNTSRMHSLADGIALVGIRPRNNPHDVTKDVLEITSDKQIQATGFDGVVISRGASHNKVRVYPTETLIEGAETKIKIRNTAENMFTLLNDLINLIENLVVDPTQGYKTNAATVVLLEVIKTRLALLMEA